jgi:alpha-tubulin suppressor-like RCC1 family protein
VDVALGFQHAACVTAAGAVLTWGKGERGQLGNGERLNAPHPSRCALVADPAGYPQALLGKGGRR